MAAGVRTAALAAVIGIVAVACGRPVASTASRASRTTATTTISGTSGAGTTAEVVPLIPETGAPPQPPAVRFVVHSGARDLVVPGHLYTGDWPSADSPVRQAATYPVPWPALTTIPGGDDPTLALGTAFMPDFVAVKVYAEIDRASLVPIGFPIATFGCNRFSAPRCRVLSTPSGLRILGLDQTIYAGTYLMVYGQWHQPSKPRIPSGYPTGPGDLAASWMFHVRHTRAPAALP
jgi:hypothetical protein